MNNKRYIIYARKSSEDKSRQITSIEDQVCILQELADKLKFSVVEIIQEKGSAKKPGRKGFNQLLEKIHAGEADGILCWKLDRLSRNPIDGGQVIWMLQQNLIKHIKTYSTEYYPHDNVMMMYVELGAANQYIKDLNTNVTRGTSRKAERGWNPSSVLPIGYKHNPLYLSRESVIEIIPDPKRFAIVQQLWKLLLKGSYSIMDLKREADRLGLVNKKGQSYSLNTFHLLFKNEFYCGFFYWKVLGGERKKFTGKHQVIITPEEFEKAQIILGNYSNDKRVRTHIFPYRGATFCGQCGGYVTAEYIHQIICTSCKHKFSIKSRSDCPKCDMDIQEMKNPSQVIKRYYRCLRKNNKPCKEKSIEEKVIEKTILSSLQSHQLPVGFFQWATKKTNSLQKHSGQYSQMLPKLKSDAQKLDKRLEVLIQMRADGEIDAVQFQTIQSETKTQLNALQSEIHKHEHSFENNKQLVLERLNRSKRFYDSFIEAQPEEKNRLLTELGYNLSLKDKKVSIIRPKWMIHLQKEANHYSRQIERLQPKNNVDLQRDLDQITPLNLIGLSE